MDASLYKKGGYYNPGDLKYRADVVEYLNILGTVRCVLTVRGRRFRTCNNGESFRGDNMQDS